MAFTQLEVEGQRGEERMPALTQWSG